MSDIQRIRADALRLISVSDFLYTCAKIIGWAIGIIGGISAVVAFFTVNFLTGIGILLITAFVCFANYILAVLSTHVAKVLAHTSHSTIGILELLTKVTLTSAIDNNLSTKNFTPPAQNTETLSNKTVNFNSTFITKYKSKLTELGYKVSESTSSDGITKYEVSKGEILEIFYTDQDFINYAKNLL